MRGRGAERKLPLRNEKVKDYLKVSGIDTSSFIPRDEWAG
jgi:hypothetical protein